MEPALVIALVAVLIVAVVMLGLRRRPRQDEGMQTFRRHIDALSPEARREVMDRARRHDARDGAGLGAATDPGIAPRGRGADREPEPTDAGDVADVGGGDAGGAGGAGGGDGGGD